MVLCALYLCQVARAPIEPSTNYKALNTKYIPLMLNVLVQQFELVTLLAYFHAEQIAH